MAAAATAARSLGRSKPPKRQVIALTDAAANRIKELLSRRGKEFLKLGVKSRGCSGLSYTMSYSGTTTRHARWQTEWHGTDV